MIKSAMAEMYDELAEEFAYARSVALKLKQKEKQQIIDAILYALDEDGHTGEWKLRFANAYYEDRYGKA